MATETQTKLVGFCLGDKANYNATNYANHIWFDPTNKQILLNGIEYIPKKLSELVNDKNFITSITKAMVEGVLTGNITSHTHSYLPLTGGTIRTTSATTLNIKAGTSKMDSILRFTDNDTSEIYEILLRRPASIYGLQCKINDNYYNLIHSGNYNSYAATKDHTHTFASITSKPNTLGGYGITDAYTKTETDTKLGKYLPLAGGTLTGSLTCNGYHIDMNNDSGSRGYRGFFNQSNNTNRASGSHIFMGGGGYALGTNSVSIGYQAYAGIRNEDADKTTYPYIAWQWMPTAKFMVDTTNSATLSGGEYYGFPLMPNEMVRWSIDEGQKVIYENSSSYNELLVVIKASDADTGLVFGGKTSLPYRASKTLIAGKYIVGSGEYLKNITEITINNVKYYQVIIYTWNTTAFPTYYDFTQHVKVMCATKVSNSNYSGASSYASGAYSVASGNSSVASGAYSVASGNYSVASGYSSVASGRYSVASGSSSVASGDFSVVLARNGETMSSYQTIVGKFNAKVAGLFIIGNGTSDTARSNAFVVDDSGNVTAKYFSGYANAVGGEGFKIYPENNNQINFGGTGSDNTVVFGAASKDSRSVPTTYKFGADGKATLLGSADMLDGYHETKFFRHRGAANSTSISSPPTSSDLANITGIGSYVVQHSGHSSHLLNFNCEGGSTQYIQFLADYGNILLFRCSTDSNLGQPWKKIAFTDSSITGNSASATKLQTARSLWGNSFDGSGSVSGDLKFVADGMSYAASHGMRIGSTYGGFIGFSKIMGKDQPDGSIAGGFKGISLGWGKDPETDAASVRINNSIFTYKSYPILHSNNFSDYAPTKTGGGASGTWGISISGNAATATKLGASSVGSATQPIYLNGGTPTACTYTLGKSVPSNAVFTDTTYSVATASADGLMSAAMFKAQMLKSVGIKQGDEMVKPDGTITITDHSMYITQDKSNINGVYVTSSVDGGGVKIPNATKNYDGSMSYTDKRKLDAISSYAPKKVVALRLSYTYGSVTVISGGGDYDMTQDAELMGSKYVEQTSTNILYLTTFSLDTAAASTDTLNNLFGNSFVKFSFMGKSTSGISDYSITVKSNFDGDVLAIQLVSTKQDDSWVVDCVWEFF